MEKMNLDVNEMEMEMITLTEDEKKFVESLETGLAGGGGAKLFCVCIN